MKSSLLSKVYLLHSSDVVSVLWPQYINVDLFVKSTSSE